MSAAITTAPKNISFSKNPILLVIASDDYLAAAAAISVNFLQFTGPVAADTVFVLSWKTAAATMTAKAVPDDSGLQFPSGDGSDDYTTSLLDYFTGNRFLDRDFIITTDLTGANPRLIFTARVPGPNYDFNSLNAGASGVITAGVTDQPVANFAHHIELWFDNGVDAAQLAYSANVPLDEPLNGKTSLDIHEELHAYLKSDRPILMGNYAQCPGSIASFYIKYAQYRGDDPFIRQIKRSQAYFINKGGLGMQPNLVRDLVAELCPVPLDASKNRFLRQGSKNKLVTKDQPEWLTWISFGDDATVILEITVYNTDNTSVVFTAVTVNGIVKYDKYQFGAGYTQLNIGGAQTIDKIPVYYTARIKAGANYLTDTYAFVIDYQYREWPRYIVYENSYGAFQTIGTVGKGQLEYDRSKDDAQLSVDRSFAALEGEFLECNITIQEKGTVNIGYDRSGRRNTQLLRELLLSRKVYLFDNGRLIPIGFNTKNLKDAMDGVNVYANALEYFVLYEAETWTEDPALADDPLAGLIVDAGNAIPDNVPPDTTGSGAIVVEFGDPHLSIVGGEQKYTAPVALAGKNGYRIWTTQMGVYFRTADIAYDPAGSFTILVPGFVLEDGEQLIILPTVLNPD